MSLNHAIPEGWKRRRLRFDVEVNPVKSEIELPPDTEVSFVPMDAVGELGGLDLSQARPLDEVYNGYTYFADGDVCVAKITPCFENGKGALAQDLTNGVAFGTTELHVLRPLEGLDARFLFYMTLAHDFRSFGEAEMLGAGGQKRVPEGFLNDWRPPLPPLDVQRQIAQFLDEKTARIDALIEKKRALLDRLAEKRQALITRAVTQGLNPDVPRKPSGIDWLGDVPVHWEVLPVRRIAINVATGRTPPSAEDDYLSNGELNWYTPGDFTAAIELRDSARKITAKALEDGVATLFPPGTVMLVGIGATLGKVAVSVESGSANQQITAIIPESNNDHYYLAYFLHGFRHEIRVMSNGNTLGILNQDGTKALPALRPPLKEQRRISAFLKEHDSLDAKVRVKVQNSLDLLEEYRSALITAAVTGQIEELR